MTESDQNLEARWLAGDVHAARALAADMTAGELRSFVTEALAACCNVVDAPPPAVLTVIQAGKHEASGAHAAFDAVRELTLRAETRRDNSASVFLLLVAEHAARVIYNSTNPDDPFDADSEEYVFRSTANFCMALPGDARDLLAKQLVQVLTSIRALRASRTAVQTIREDKLAARWFVGEPDACRMLAAGMTGAQLRTFGVEALEASCAVVGGVPTAALRVVEIGKSTPHLGRVAFDAVHELRLAAEATTQPVSQLARVLRVAECVARIVYNSTEPDDPFEPASGEWLFEMTGSLCCALPTDSREQLSGQLLRALVTANSSPGQ